MNAVSPGEIMPGMWIMSYETLIEETRMNPYTGQYEDLQKWVKQPWFAGIPWKVHSVALPIVAVHNFKLQPDFKVPICFLDTRIQHFIEVGEEYGLEYIKAMREQQQPPPMLQSTINLCQ